MFMLWVCPCVTIATGELYSWGSGIFGQLGHGNLRDRFSPLMVGMTLRGVAVTQVACHDYYSAAVTDDGELYTWGRAGPHLGYDAKATKQTTPRKVDLHGNKVKMVACGISHTLSELLSMSSRKFVSASDYTLIIITKRMCHTMLWGRGIWNRRFL